MEKSCFVAGKHDLYASERTFPASFPLSMPFKLGSSPPLPQGAEHKFPLPPPPPPSPWQDRYSPSSSSLHPTPPNAIAKNFLESNPPLLPSEVIHPSSFSSFRSRRQPGPGSIAPSAPERARTNQRPDPRRDRPIGAGQDVRRSLFPLLPLPPTEPGPFSFSVEAAAAVW